MRLSILTVATLFTLGCGAPPARLDHSEESAEGLARAVLRALERQDVNALNNLALTEREFHAHVWPELPAARPERNLPFSYVWGDLHQKSVATLTQTLAHHGGRHYELVRVRFARVSSFRRYRIHRDSELTIRDSNGREQQVRLFGSVLARAGEFKVFSYVAE